MGETLTLALALAAGAGLGTLFFGGLWWTVRKGLSSERPALWFFGSLLLRTSIVLAGFYVVSGRQWQRLLLCLLGFVVAHRVVNRVTRPAAEAQTLSAREAGHAPQPR